MTEGHGVGSLESLRDQNRRRLDGVPGERAEVLGALAMVLRDSDRFLSSQLRLAAGPR